MLSDLIFKGFAKVNDQIYAVFSDGRSEFHFTEDILEHRINTMKLDGLDTSMEEEVMEKFQYELTFASMTA